MTEYERIAKKHNWSLSIEEKEKCGFLVSEKLRKIQLIELDLLIEFERLCAKYSLKYFVMFGTLLGAVRHHGFIPWDDDVDVVMPREDYNKLILLGNNDVSSPYFLQIPGKNEGYYFSFIKFRNSNTTAISYPFRDENFNQGIFLDIFPIDNCCMEDMEENWNKIKALALENSANMRRSLINPSKLDKERIEKYPKSDPQQVYDKIEEIAQQHNDKETEYVGCLATTFYPIHKMVFKREILEKTILYQFEDMCIRVPQNYDEILKIIYGDYMTLPPKEQRGIRHSSTIFDPDIPYQIWRERGERII